MPLRGGNSVRQARCEALGRGARAGQAKLDLLQAHRQRAALDAPVCGAGWWRCAREGRRVHGMCVWVERTSLHPGQWRRSSIRSAA